MPDGVWAVVVAGGEGRRFGGPKQFSRVGGRLIVEWAVDAARTAADGVVLVVPPADVDEAAHHAGCSVVVAGGATRAGSVRAGLARVPEATGIVIVHDAARPAASPDLFAAVVAAVRAGADAAVPCLPVADTLKRVRDGRVEGTVDRSGLSAVQTPQAFRAVVLRRAHEGCPEATDDAALVEAIGGVVTAVPGEAHNRKITDAADLAVVGAWLGGAGSTAGDG
ncbi:MAG: 2-C-methyl-D-erythritol 4-phosphate cytidylyltransferase [Acidimicrobiales bacterium]